MCALEHTKWDSKCKIAKGLDTVWAYIVTVTFIFLNIIQILVFVPRISHHPRAAVPSQILEIWFKEVEEYLTYNSYIDAMKESQTDIYLRQNRITFESKKEESFSR